jgi:hypothetical protein
MQSLHAFAFLRRQHRGEPRLDLRVLKPGIERQPDFDRVVAERQ